MATDINFIKHLGRSKEGTSILLPTPDLATYSILLDGNDAYVDCGTASDLNFERTDSFSFSFWVKRKTTGTNDVIVARQNASGNQRGYFVNLNTADRLVIQLRNNTSNNSQRLNVQSTTLIQDTNWHHMVVSYNGTSTVNSFKMYIDGRRDIVTNKLGTLSATIAAPSALFLMGSLHTGIAAPADVYLDEVAVFDYQLTDGGVSEGQGAGGQVGDIYNCGIPNNITSLSPVSYWRFEEGTGTTTADLGSASNTGTLENDATFDTNVPTNVIAFANTKSLDLDGISDYVGMARDTLQFNRTTPFSLSLWINMAAAEFSVILSKAQNGGVFPGYQIWQNNHGSNTTNKLAVRLRKNASDYVQIETSGTFNKNQWYHVAATYDGSGSNTGIRLYVDGVNQSGVRQGTLSSDLSWSPDYPFNIGSRNNGNQEFEGLVDEVAVFDYQLTNTNVSTIYGTGEPTSLESLSPICWWRCGDGFDTDDRLINQGSLCTIHGIINNLIPPPFSSNVPIAPLINTKSTVFDGISELVNMGNASSLNFDHNDPYTLSVWVKRDTTGTGVIIEKMETSGNKTGYQLAFISDTIRIYHRRQDQTYNRIYRQTDNTFTSTTDWYHIVATYDGSLANSGLKIYVNGSEAASTGYNSMNAGAWTNNADFKIGRSQDAHIDEVAVFNTELSASDVTTIYNSGTPTNLAITSGLVSWWRMGDGDTFPTITDNAGSVDGTMENMDASDFVSDVPT
jgi:hypothetical protein